MFPFPFPKLDWFLDFYACFSFSNAPLNHLSPIFVRYLLIHALSFPHFLRDIANASTQTRRPFLDIDEYVRIHCKYWRGKKKKEEGCGIARIARLQNTEKRYIRQLRFKTIHHEDHKMRNDVRKKKRKKRRARKKNEKEKRVRRDRKEHERTSGERSGGKSEYTQAYCVLYIIVVRHYMRTHYTSNISIYSSGIQYVATTLVCASTKSGLDLSYRIT